VPSAAASPSPTPPDALDEDRIEADFNQDVYALGGEGRVLAKVAREDHPGELRRVIGLDRASTEEDRPDQCPEAPAPIRQLFTGAPIGFLSEPALPEI